MNKTIIIIAGALTILGLTGAIIFNKINLETAGLIATTMIGLLFSLNKNEENKELKETNKNLSTKLVIKETEALNTLTKVNKLNTENSLLKKEIEGHIETSIYNKNNYNKLLKDYKEVINELNVKNTVVKDAEVIKIKSENNQKDIKNNTPKIVKRNHNNKKQ